MLEQGRAGPWRPWKPGAQRYRGGLRAVKRGGESPRRRFTPRASGRDPAARAGMIRLPPPETALAPAERYGLDLLVDLSRVLPAEDAGAMVTELCVMDEPGRFDTLERCVAGGWGISEGNGVVRVPRGALRLVADLAGAGAEQRATARDRHGRVPSGENALVAAGPGREPGVAL